ncbi:MAG: ZIP family metal transporter [Halanaerobium sp.]|nr:ZIP family metal transporter [Halanaerobium sp.]
MYQTIYITMIGLITGILGTAGGGLLVIGVKKLRETFLCVILGVSAGIMTVVVFFDLLPEALVVGNLWTALLGLAMGAILIGLLDLTFPHQHFSSRYEGNQRYFKAGLLLALGIALHNIPEGLAIGAGYSSDTALGLGIAVLMAVQNLPEGMAVGTTLCMAGMRNSRTLLVTILAGLPMGLGALLGNLLGNISMFTLSISLGFAAGAMLYIIFDELIPDAHQKADGHWAISGILSGIFLGLVLTNLI